ncbi:MAG: hypothetical protein JSS78_03540 [Bacteroidetes bacterium]|nr:hypothetical protein [Bacteroidota bacterium]
MAHKKKTWAEKMNPNATWFVEKTTKKFADMPEGCMMLVPTPLLIENYIKNIPFGHTANVQQMRKDLAASFHAEYTCPLTSGIFLRIVAEKAFEELWQGKNKDEVAPFWRIINRQSATVKKLSFDYAFIHEMRSQEEIPD